MSAPRREVLAEGVEIWLGDCRDVLPLIGNVDALIWDPPWGIGFSEYESHKDCPLEYLDWISATLEASEALVSDGYCVVFQGAKRAWEWPSLIRREYRLMACAKNFTQILPGKGPIWSTDFALFWPVGEPSVEHGKGRDWHLAITSNMATRPKGHPCPRPLDQMMYVVNCFSEHGQRILDPTMGSGTTGVAAVSLGREFVGIEIEPKYFDIARRRISDALARPDMFIPAPKITAKQETLL